MTTMDNCRVREIMMTFLLATVVLSASAVPGAFSCWPTGLDPQTVGGRVVEQFRSTEPESYHPKGFSAGPYGGGFKTSTYSFYRDYHVWNMVRPGREAAWMWTGYDPYEFKPGRHTLRIKPIATETGSVEITDFALTDEPAMFEPH